MSQDKGWNRRCVKEGLEGRGEGEEGRELTGASTAVVGQVPPNLLTWGDISTCRREIEGRGDGGTDVEKNKSGEIGSRGGPEARNRVKLEERDQIPHHASRKKGEAEKHKGDERDERSGRMNICMAEEGIKVIGERVWEGTSEEQRARGGEFQWATGVAGAGRKSTRGAGDRRVGVFARGRGMRTQGGVKLGRLRKYDGGDKVKGRCRKGDDVRRTREGARERRGRVKERRAGAAGQQRGPAPDSRGRTVSEWPESSEEASAVSFWRTKRKSSVNGVGDVRTREGVGIPLLNFHAAEKGRVHASTSAGSINFHRKNTAASAWFAGREQHTATSTSCLNAVTIPDSQAWLVLGSKMFSARSTHDQNEDLS
ncbi:hypothetical protein B0H14DRAFT_2637538 [Mycena olivaceomarginata]|nr:hypothetical protein B0H14DRAFT_2637538 [Mycena olivaceomarginata]